MNVFEKLLIFCLASVCCLNFGNILLEHFAFGSVHKLISEFHETLSFYQWTQSSSIAAFLLPLSSQLYGLINIENNIFRKNEYLCFREVSTYEFENNCRISLSRCYLQNNSTAQYIEIVQHASYTRYERRKWIAAEDFIALNSTLQNSDNLKAILYSTDDHTKMEWNGCNCYYFLTGNGVNKFEASFCNEYLLNVTRSLIVSSDEKDRYINNFDICDGRMCSKVEMVQYLNRFIFSQPLN